MNNKDSGIKILSLTIFFIFLIFFGRAFQLQVVEGKQNRFLAENNRIRRMVIEAPRGMIFERHQQPLAVNVPDYFIAGKDEIKESISRDEALKLQAEKNDSNLRVVFKREYLKGEIFSHLLGYLGEVSEKELVEEKLDLKGYSVGNLLGRSGAEAQYEDLLKGHNGSELVEVDTQGKIFRRAGKILPDSGKNLILAVDGRLQEFAVEIYNKVTENKGKGAIIATNPKNGEVLLLYSSPSFDNNIFLQRDKELELLKLINDEADRPLINRVIAGRYPPGSTFKIVTSIAGLEEGKITPNTLINDPGVIVVNDYKYANWYFTSHGATEGEVSLKKAIARSVDTYFYKVGEFLGAEKLIKWAKIFGLDGIYGIDLPGETAGFIATPEWKEKNRNEKWFLGNTYHMAIGQGDVAITPLADNLMTAVVANGGKICTPRILRIGSENTPYREECRQLPIRKEYLDEVKKGMVAACLPGGTSSIFAQLPFSVACKTGTAETGEGKTTHAWFTVFAPVDDPQIVLTVLVEKGGEGSSVSAPIAKEILKEYFK